MRKIKKLLLVIVVLLLSVMSINVNAMSESELVTKIKKTYVVNGIELKVSASQLTELERYLNKYELSSEDCDYISNKIDEVVKLAQDAKATSYSDLTNDEATKLIAIVSDVSENTSIKATLTKGGILTIFEEDGKTPFTVINDKDGGIKNTDNNYFIIVIASVISLLGVVVITKKVAGANA